MGLRLQSEPRLVRLQRLLERQLRRELAATLQLLDARQ
jgi:hypothetical protein